jgi:hypothetical protein
MDSSFTRLQAIVLRNIHPDKSVISLFYLKSLPHLFSLTMYFNVDEQDDYDLSNIYRMILTFSSLKYNKISVLSCFEDEYEYEDEDEHTKIFVPLAFNERFNTIEYLIIDHPCTLNEIFSIIYHTPCLCHLTCRRVTKSREEFQNVNPITLNKLTHIRFDMYDAWFDDFKIFMSKLFASVQVLRIRYYTGSDYLEADVWEQLIKNHIPYLHTFDYKYREDYMTNDEDDHFHAKINRFTSPFWIQHQWIFEFEINMDEQSLYCSIHPYRYTFISNLFYRSIQISFQEDMA